MDGRRRGCALAAPCLAVLLVACSDGDADTSAAADLQARVLELRQQAVDALPSPAGSRSTSSALESLVCDDTGDPAEAGLVRATAGHEVTVPGGGSSELASTASQDLAARGGWSRVASPVGDAWEVVSADGFTLVVRAVEPDLLAVQVTSPCRDPA